MRRPVHPEVMIERVLQGASPRQVVESAVTTYLYYQQQRLLRDIVRECVVTGTKGHTLQVRVNGVNEEWVPEEGVDMKAVTNEIKAASSPQRAMELLKQYATKRTSK